MDTLQSKLETIFGLYDCARAIFLSLDRSSLKNLRLTCKSIDDSILSNHSHLFSRAYISANLTDINTLEAIGCHPRISRCVQELVWDISMKPDLLRQRGPFSFETQSNMYRHDRIVNGYDTISEQGLDFTTMLKVLPQFPRLQDVRFIELMAAWARKGHSGRSHQQDGLDPFPPHYLHFESPAMREWRALGIDPLLPATWIPARHLDAPETLIRSICCDLEPWANEVLSGSEGEAHPLDLLQSIQHCPERAPILLSAVVRALHLKLRSYSIDAAPDALHRRTASQRKFVGVNLSLFTRLESVMTGFLDNFGSLTNLCLSLNNGADIPTIARQWLGPLKSVLKHAGNLETVELRVCQPDSLKPIQFFPFSPKLKELVLVGFIVEKAVLEEEFLPWCFKTNLNILHLADCRFQAPLGSGEMDFFRWLLDQDTLSKGPLPISDWELSGILSDEDDQSDRENIDDSTPKNTKRARFMDIKFDSDSDEDDADYFPCTPEMCSRHLDAPFCDPDADDAAEVLTDVYYMYYASEDELAYDNDYENDTPPVQDELPMPGLRADLARLLSTARGESLELSFSGSDWGSGADQTLSVMIDNFQFSAE